MRKGWVSRVAFTAFPRAFRGTIRIKLAAVFTLLIGSIALFILFYFPARLQQQALAGIHDKARAIGVLTAANISTALFSGEREKAQATLESVRRSTDVVSLVVLDKSGQVFASLNQEGGGVLRRRGAAGNVQEERSIYTSKVGIWHSGQVIGELELGFPLDGVKAEIASSQRTVALVSLLIFILGWIAIEIGSLVITSPLARMVEAVEQIEAGDFSQRIEMEPEGELGHLARVFNSMFEKVESAYGELESLAKTLEKRVEERTRELQVEIQERERAEKQLQAAYLDLRKSHRELQAAQLRLMQAEKLESVGQLAAGVAHEVKNPLATILLGVRYISEHLTTQDENVTQLLADMSDAIDRAHKVISELLDFSRPRELDRKPEQLNPIVERSLVLVRHDLDRCQIQVQKALGGDLPELMLDASKVQQVLVIVFTNAIHAMESGGTLTVKTYTLPPLQGSSGKNAAQEEPQIVGMDVEDTGSGIPEEKLGKVFDPFYTTKPTGKGTGLGLSVARQIIEMHGGTIDIRNRREGGVRVTLTFKAGSERRLKAREAQ